MVGEVRCVEERTVLLVERVQAHNASLLMARMCLILGCLSVDFSLAVSVVATNQPEVEVWYTLVVLY